MTEKTETIRCRCFEPVVNKRYNFSDKYKLKADYLEYYSKQFRKHDRTGSSYTSTSQFRTCKCTFGKIDIEQTEETDKATIRNIAIISHPSSAAQPAESR